MSAVHSLQSLPLSPSSPPESGLKQQKRRLSDDNLPDSPNSPPLMSVTANRYVSNYGDARQGTSDPPQSGPADMQRQQSASALPTPANSVTGSMKAGEAEDLDQHRDKRQRLDTEEREASDHIIPGLSIHHTNHERHPVGSSSGNAKSSAEAKEDVGVVLFLSKTRHPRVMRLQPDPNEHLMSIYGLNPILKKVARVDPSSGEKINPMRKSYENQVKSFELAGLNKPVKKDLQPPFNPGRLLTKYRTQPQKDGFEIDANMREKLPKAVQMQPGKVRKHEEWERLLGHEKPKAPAPQPVQPTQPAAHMRSNGVGRQPMTKPQQETNRPRRQGKRRRYDDDSFEGYNGYADGFVDEDNSDSDDTRGTGRKKQRKPDEEY